MKTLKITPPPGHEIDKEKSTFEEIVFKKIEVEFPDAVKKISNRIYYLGVKGDICTTNSHEDINQLSTKERAEAFLALMQLVELRDYVNGDWKAEFDNGDIKYCVQIKYQKTIYISKVLHFKSAELRDRFQEKYSNLIRQAKELL